MPNLEELIYDLTVVAGVCSKREKVPADIAARYLSFFREYPPLKTRIGERLIERLDLIADKGSTGEPCILCSEKSENGILCDICRQKLKTVGPKKVAETIVAKGGKPVGQAAGNTHAQKQNLEEMFIEELVKFPKTFRYEASSENREVTLCCQALIDDIIGHLSELAQPVQEAKANLRAKKARSGADYGTALINNIVFELYKYDTYLRLYDNLNFPHLKDLNMDRVDSLILDDAKTKMKSARDYGKENAYIRGLVSKYESADTEAKEFDYVFACMKTSVMMYFAASTIVAEIDVGRGREPVIDVFKRSSPEIVKATINNYLMINIAGRLNSLY